MWDNICRLCSSRGDYDIFAIIPSYLHASPNEFLLWQKPINKLLEETTGLSVEADDGLPQKMCALCISYLKHAATFRQQAINNAISLKAVSAISGRGGKNSTRGRTIIAADAKADDKASVLITANDLIYSDERKTDTNRLVNILNNQTSKITKSDESMKKFLLLNENPANNSNSISTNGQAGRSAADENEDELAMTYLNLLFEKDNNASARKMKRLSQQKAVNRRPPGNNNLAAIFDEITHTASDPLGEEFQTASSDENEAVEQKKNFFSYKEKNFEEDDVMDLDELKEANITINIPETCKERKCRACFRRFMFEESYKEHMDTCIEYKFLLFIEEINRLLDIRRSKAVSPHEFIRRMIFCLRKTCHWLKSSCGEILLPDLLINGETKNRSDEKNSTAEISSGVNSDETTEKFAQEANASGPERSKSLLEILKQDAGCFIVPENSLASLYPQSGTGLLDNCSVEEETENLRKPAKFENILSLIDGLEGIDKQQETDPSLHTPVKKVNEERSNFFEKLKNASLPQFHVVSTKNSFLHVNNISYPSIYSDKKISARCNTCNTVFDSVAALEGHNANFHNGRAAKLRDEHNKNIISLFEDDDNSAETSPTTTNNF